MEVLSLTRCTIRIPASCENTTEKKRENNFKMLLNI